MGTLLGVVDTLPAFLMTPIATIRTADMQGGNEMTLYASTVNSGALGIQRVRHAVGCALLAYRVSLLVSVVFCRRFWGHSDGRAGHPCVWRGWIG